jgi:hypothetical protein
VTVGGEGLGAFPRSRTQNLEVKLLARGFLDLERQCASARSDAQGAADAEALREVCALAAGMGELSHPLSMLRGQVDVLDEIRRAATVAVPDPELLQLVPQIDGFTNILLAGHGFMYVSGDDREMYFRRHTTGVACAKTLTGIVVGFHDRSHMPNPCRNAVSRVADALRRLDL